VKTCELLNGALPNDYWVRNKYIIMLVERVMILISKNNNYCISGVATIFYLVAHKSLHQTFCRDDSSKSHAGIAHI